MLSERIEGLSVAEMDGLLGYTRPDDALLTTARKQQTQPRRTEIPHAVSQNTPSFLPGDCLGDFVMWTQD